MQANSPSFILHECLICFDFFALDLLYLTRFFNGRFFFFHLRPLNKFNVCTHVSLTMIWDSWCFVNKNSERAYYRKLMIWWLNSGLWEQIKRWPLRDHISCKFYFVCAYRTDGSHYCLVITGMSGKFTYLFWYNLCHLVFNRK